jgi:3-hydroxybutyryl-CoA dehydrogenase
MRCGIAEVAARSGCDVVLREVNDVLVEASIGRLEASLDTAVPALLLRKVEAGDLGRKSGRGFLTYDA